MQKTHDKWIVTGFGKDGFLKVVQHHQLMPVVSKCALSKLGNGKNIFIAPVSAYSLSPSFPWILEQGAEIHQFQTGNIPLWVALRDIRFG